MSEEKLVILVVEDEEDTRQILKSCLSRKYPEYEVLSANNGVEALQIFQERSPGEIVLVITDYCMPLMNGAQLCRELKKNRAGDGLVVLTSASSGSGDAPGGLTDEEEKMFDDVLYKPLNFNALFDAVERMLRRRSGSMPAHC